jgi:hypothetical protein
MTLEVQCRSLMPCVLEVLADPVQDFLVGAPGTVYEAGALVCGERTVATDMVM